MALRRWTSSVTSGAFEIGSRFRGPAWCRMRDHVRIGLDTLGRPSDHVETALSVHPADQRVQVSMVVVFVDPHASLRRSVFESRQYAQRQRGGVGADATAGVNRQLHLELGGFPAHVARL